MALWGDIDVAAVTGTNITTNGSANVVCGGGDGLFTTELAVGEYLVFSNQAGVEYQIKSITDKDNLVLTAVTTNTNAANLTATKTEKPTYDNTNVVGMTSAEAGTIGAGPGWVKVTEGTGGRAGRVQYETLVAFGDHTKPSESSNLDDATFGVITLATIADVSAASGSAETIQVVATTTNNVVPSYQWQLRTTGSYANLANGGVYGDVTTDTLAISSNAGLNGNRYRCVVSGAGATTVISNGAKLIES